MADDFLGVLGADENTPVFVISVAAAMAGMHPQPLRQYDRMGLVSPDRASGRGRRYSANDIAMLREVQRLSQDGINLAGVKRILELESHVGALQQRLSEVLAELDATRAEIGRRAQAVHRSYRRDLVPFTPPAVVVWQPKK